MNDPKNPHQFEEDIRLSFGVPEIRAEFIQRLQRDLARQAEGRSRQSRSFFGLKPAWVIALAILLMMMIATVVIGPQRVYAEFLRIFGYIPGVGFVNLDQVRVLKNSVIQEHEGHSVTAMRGVINARGTDIWLEFSDGARPVNDAWLESADGVRFELIGWGYSPDEPGSNGVAMHFAPLPAQIDQVTLVLPEGWHLLLTWVAGSESSLTPVNIVTEPFPSTAETVESSQAGIPTSEPNPCAEAMGIKFCVEAATRAENEMQVLIGTSSDGQVTPGSRFNLSMFEVPGETDQLTLGDSDGKIYPVDTRYLQPGGDATGETTALSFPGAQEAAGRLSMNIPAIIVSIPLNDQISIDLGSHPTAGQVLEINQTIDVAGMPVHFSQDTLVGSGEDSLMLKLTSDLIEGGDHMLPYMIEPGRPEGIQDRYGSGSENGRMTISVELIQQSGLKTGVLNIPLVSASILVSGPFTLTFDAPVEQAQPTATPQIVENDIFEPLPVGEQLPMDAYQYTGRELKPGDMLSITFDGEKSILYAASPETGFAPEEVAVLPGHVLAVNSYPDRSGIDYLVGEYEAQTSSTIYRQLYTLRYGDPSPKLLIGQFEHTANSFAWSHDGRFLAYLANEDQPGQNYQRYVRIIDLDCRLFGDCQAFTADTGSQDVFMGTWSPDGYQMALGGTPQDQPYGESDIFVLNINAETHQTTLANLTQSPQINDQAPAQWTTDGKGLVYPCWTGQETSANDYSLCHNDLSEGKDEVSSVNLPWNMRMVHLAADRWLVDWFPAMHNGVYSLRTYDMENDQGSTLLDWPANGKYIVETSVSPDGRWAATVIDDQGGLLALNIQTHEKVVVMAAELQPSFVGWVH